MWRRCTLRHRPDAPARVGRRFRPRWRFGLVWALADLLPGVRIKQMTASPLYDSEVDDWQMQESTAQPTGPAGFLFCGASQLSVVHWDDLRVRLLQLTTDHWPLTTCTSLGATYGCVHYAICGAARYCGMQRGPLPRCFFRRRSPGHSVTGRPVPMRLLEGKGLPLVRRVTE
jgi:hypothetical protein